MTDRSTDALDVARANAAGVGRAGANVRLAHGEWFDALPADLCGRLALVVSNPPYVAIDDGALEPVVRDWEPALALFGGEDGLDEIRRIVGDSARWLRPGGWLVIEIGSSHGRAVGELLRESGFDEVTITPDPSGHDRVAVGRRSER
jgi:release factor glutamine methyltransferase